MDHEFLRDENGLVVFVLEDNFDAITNPFYKCMACKNYVRESNMRKTCYANSAKSFGVTVGDVARR